MGGEEKRESYGIAVFRPGTPAGVKIRQTIFFVLFCLIILVQSCYWLFANAAKPIVMGLPFGMFFVVLMIALEFVALLVLYLMEGREQEE